MSDIIYGKNIILSIWSGKTRPRFVVCDTTYWIPAEEDIKNIYSNYRNWLITMKLAKWYHKWDCDNFSEAFKVYANGYYFNNINSNAESIAVGFVHYMAGARAEGGGRGEHAANVFLTRNKDGNIVLKGFEPQNGRIFDFTQSEFDSINLFYI